jgi:hypothetical protein
MDVFAWAGLEGHIFALPEKLERIRHVILPLHLVEFTFIWCSTDAA